MNARFPSTRAGLRAAVGALAAELGHDLQTPLNLFRLATDRLGRGQALDEEDVSLLREELERLSRLSSRLRGLAQRPLQKTACPPRQLVELALSTDLLAPLAAPRATDGARALPLEIDVSDEVRITCDSELLARALSELIANALEAKTERAGVRFEVGAAPGFCVWDDGAGFELSAEESLRWGTTTRPGASGLGLTVALRAARAHGFSLNLRRIAAFTEAWLWVPATSVTQPSPEAEA